jgi:hypothetical protein
VRGGTNLPAVTVAPDTLALGLYTIAAESAGVPKGQDNIDTKAAVPPVTFTLP